MTSGVFINFSTESSCWPSFQPTKPSFKIIQANVKINVSNKFHFPYTSMYSMTEVPVQSSIKTSGFRQEILTHYYFISMFVYPFDRMGTLWTIFINVHWTRLHTKFQKWQINGFRQALLKIACLYTSNSKRTIGHWLSRMHQSISSFISCKFFLTILNII